MPVIISLLRGVNLGGHNLIKMEALRALCQSLRLEHVQTYVQSGNIVFRTEDRDVKSLPKELENAIENTFGFRSAVVLRTLPEWRGVVAKNPFAGRPEISPNKLLVAFLAGDPGREARDKLSLLKIHPEEIQMERRELYIYFPDGMGRSKLSIPAIDKALSTTVTGRNWNTVLKLLAMAEALQATP